MGREVELLMSIKKKLGMGVVTAALGISLIGGGTFAYFSDTAEQTSVFASGVVDLTVKPTELINLDKFKPGDHQTKTFELKNGGNIDMKNIALDTVYTVTKGGNQVENSLANQYANSIIVKFLANTSGDTGNNIIDEMTLLELRNMTQEQLAERLDWKWSLKPFPGYYAPVEGLKAGEVADFKVKFEFEETGKAQNDLQGLELNLEWTFEGFQVDGGKRN